MLSHPYTPRLRPLSPTLVTLAALLVALVGCAAGSSTLPEPAVQPQAGPPFADTIPEAERNLSLFVPRRVERFHFAGGRRYEDPNLGFTFRYLGPDSTVADVFVYPGPDFGPECGRACAAELLKSEIDTFVAGWPQLIEEGNADSIAIRGDVAVPAGRFGPHQMGRLVNLHVRRDDGSVVRSDYNLFLVPGSRFKLRVTYADTAPVNAYVAEFSERVLTAFATQPRQLPDSATREQLLRAIEGEWSWTSEALLCGSERHTIRVSEDLQRFTISWESDTAEGMDPAVYHISAVGPGLLLDEPYVVRAAIEGEDRTTFGGKLVEWDLVLIDHDVYAWHRTDWAEDARTGSVVRCSGPPASPPPASP